MVLVAELARDWFVLRLGGSRQSSGPILSRSTEPSPTLCRVSSSTPELTRTCPCADATVIALSEEGMIRALTRHLEECPGQHAQEQEQEQEQEQV